jgi:hypothetical protein
MLSRKHGFTILPIPWQVIIISNINWRLPPKTFKIGYQLGGYTVIVPRAPSVQKISMPIEKALRFILTAGMSMSPTGAASMHVKGRMDK